MNYQAAPPMPGPTKAKPARSWWPARPISRRANGHSVSFPPAAAVFPLAAPAQVDRGQDSAPACWTGPLPPLGAPTSIAGPPSAGGDDHPGAAEGRRLPGSIAAPGWVGLFRHPSHGGRHARQESIQEHARQRGSQFGRPSFISPRHRMWISGTSQQRQNNPSATSNDARRAMKSTLAQTAHYYSV